MKISIEAGTSLPICDAASGRGGSWSKNGTIVFSPTPSGSLYEVPSSGGKPEVIIKKDTSIPSQSLRWAFFLPDGKHFIYSTENSYTGSTPTDAIFLASLESPKPKKLMVTSSNCQYANGYLLFVRQSILLAQKFDPDKLKLEGEAMPVAENIQYWDSRISGTFAISQNGKLVYLEGYQNNENLVLLNKDGSELRKLSDMVPYNSAEFSPDGNKIVCDLYDPSEKKYNIWVYDLSRSVWTRLTFDQGDIVPRWTNDGKQITYSSNNKSSGFNAYIKNADGSGDAALLCKSNYTNVATSISSDGKYFLYTGIDFAGSTSGFDIFLLPAQGDKKPIPIAATNFNEFDAKFSPDMKWIVYQSDESGKYQIYVIPFNPNNPAENSSGKWQISVDGGTEGKWMNNGKSIYFNTPDKKIMGVDINETGSSISPGKPYVVFTPGNSNVIKLYDINKTGTEITASIPNGQMAQPSITLVNNWQKEVEGNK
jgi:Tol biopolymer transport system component